MTIAMPEFLFPESRSAPYSPSEKLRDAHPDRLKQGCRVERDSGSAGLPCLMRPSGHPPLYLVFRDGGSLPAERMPTRHQDKPLKFQHNIANSAWALFAQEGSNKVETNAELNARQVIVIGNVQVFQSAARIVIRRNVIDENLQCKENLRQPVVGRNRVGGNKEYQCRRL